MSHQNEAVIGGVRNLKKLIHRACKYCLLDKASPGIRESFGYRHLNDKSWTVIEGYIIKRYLKVPK